jgi:Carboxypeptidase regulatory-like domain
MNIRSVFRVLLLSLVSWSVIPLLPANALSEDAAWGVVSSPNRGTKENELAGLAVIASDDIWAVGRYNSGRPPTVTGRDTLALHWNGTAWAGVPTPNPTWSGADFFTLEDTAAVSPTDVWSVGYAEDFASLKSTTLVERWNGSAWTIVPSPNPGGSNLPNTLSSVAVASSNDIWAVGGAGYPEQALILRWNGSRWRPVRNGCGVPLNGIDIVSATDIWAVGSATTCHFDGTTWAVIPSPQPRGEFYEIAYILQDVSATGPDDVWISGYRVLEQGEYLSFQSIIEHWNGTAWTLTTDVDGHSLPGIEALAANDVWAVGTDSIQGTVLHFDGIGWNLVPSPTPGNSGSLADVEAESADHLWAAGTALAKSLILESPSRLEGTVIGDTNVAGATVSWFGLESGSTETDSGGEFAIAGLAAGTYDLIATNPGCNPASAEVVVTAGLTVQQDLLIDC